MVTDISFTMLPEEERSNNKNAIVEKKALKALFDKGITARADDVALVFIKKSIDARHGKTKLYLKYRAYIGEKPESNTDVPAWKSAGEKTALIIGSGPAGLFSAFRLLEDGIKPIIIERGEGTSERKRDIAQISTKGEVGADSNYCFGEGGAGTFSDGKLYTRSNKRGDISKILRIFAHFGADEKILTDAHPHIGTDRLPKIVNAMCDKIRSLGGEIHFNTRCTGFIYADGTKKVIGIKARDTHTGDEKSYFADAVILATGHSATDIYDIIAEQAPTALEAKTFAVGVRVEHPRTLIDSIQYHGRTDNLPTAEYRLVTQIDGRGVYSFCMCPGGFVVPSSTDSDEIVVNGMSSAARNSKWSNAAIVVETRPEDVPEEFVSAAKKRGSVALAGLLYRKHLEQLAKQHGEAQKAPAQRMTDFINHAESETLPATSYTPGVVSSRIDEWLPSAIADRLAKAFDDFNHTMKGYKCPDALLIAIETRTSTPVRILRDKESLVCVALENLYPCGEGSGYSGGIVSSAMDGEKAAAALSKSLQLAYKK